MKLWKLIPHDDLPENDNPWEPSDRKAMGFVVRAQDEAQARELAHSHAHAENHGTLTPWLDPDYSSCKELTVDGIPMVGMCDAVTVQR
jgi:hypothetical protein